MEKPIARFFLPHPARSAANQKTEERGQKTDKFAALSRRIRWKNPSLGFSSLTRREAPQIPLSSVFYPLSSETILCPLKLACLTHGIRA
jgi:hypothetical protein